MFKVFLQMLATIFGFLKYPLFIVIGLVVLFYLLIFINVIIGLFKGKRFKKGTHKKVKEHGFLRKIFIDLPHQYSEDMFNKDPDAFRL